MQNERAQKRKKNECEQRVQRKQAKRECKDCDREAREGRWKNGIVQRIFVLLTPTHHADHRVLRRTNLIPFRNSVGDKKKGGAATWCDRLLRIKTGVDDTCHDKLKRLKIAILILNR